jgi:hypothetical protein
LVCYSYLVESSSAFTLCSTEIICRVNFWFRADFLAINVGAVVLAVSDVVVVTDIIVVVVVVVVVVAVLFYNFLLIFFCTVKPCILVCDAPVCFHILLACTGSRGSYYFLMQMQCLRIILSEMSRHVIFL